ncbi:meiotic recombination protein REC114 isoform X2 [Trichomycterus rosablanca]|uniref:meiotic recombination protein REC114 isoform X2 n=1 Tax=Trichomycterus rosablanca TaxID=2290929 RepID=UPI002F35C2AC
MSEEREAVSAFWKLKRYGRFIPKSKNSSWKVFESSESKGSLELRILESGHLIITQAQELLEGFSLLNAQSFLKIQQKSDSLLVNIKLKEESRMIRLQFEGSTRSEAVDLCRAAVQRLQEYLPTGTQESTGPSLADTSGIFNQQKEYFLGERGLSLPMAYHHFTLPAGDMEGLLRLCLLDSGFPAFVEEVENKLKRLIQE